MDASYKRPSVVVIGGPTATGKTRLSVSMAKTFGGEIINADSMQIYTGLSIGTAKATEEERKGVPHHLLDFLSPEYAYSVADFVSDASRCIQQICKAGHLPFVVGGTGLYISSLLNGVSFASEPAVPEVRQRLQETAARDGAEALYARLQTVDPSYAAKVHPNNLPRVIRALELYETTGRKMSEQQRQSKPETAPYRSLCLCLTCRDRAELYRRIDQRVDLMVKSGVLQEAEWVWQHRDTCKTAAQAIGYKEFFPYLEGTQTLDSCVGTLKQATRRYAKRQLTWFRNQNDAVWLYVDEENIVQRAEKLIEEFLKGEG